MKRYSRQLHLEPLEERHLLSTCHVARLADIGAGNDPGGGQLRGDLRYCINKANELPGHDTIDISGTGTIQLTGALPDLSTDMDILGPGPEQLTVRRDTGGSYRIFTIGAGAQVHISELTATNGNLAGGGLGGGIYNQGTLTLTHTIINGNTAGTHDGAAGTGGGIYNSGSLLIQNSAISNNTNYGISGAAGGGIYNANGGSLTIVDTTILGNLSNALLSDFTLAIGGGISNGGSATIQYSTIANNTALSQAGIFADAYGGGIHTSGPLTISNSNIRSNSTVAFDEFGGLVHGGGIYEQATTLTVDNSTIANNTSSGVYMSGGSATITHSTIAGNDEGIFINVGGPGLTLRNSIVANNTSGDLKGTITSSGFNLIGKSSGGSGYVPSDILNVDPMLGPLTDNGGPTFTMALLPGSPAIDSGTNQMAPEWDQRGPGFPRIVNGTIDIGAFEVQATGAEKPPNFLAFLLTADLDDYEI